MRTCKKPEAFRSKVRKGGVFLGRLLKNTSRLLKKSRVAGCSKTSRCKAPEILRSEAYMEVRRNDEG